MDANVDIDTIAARLNARMEEECLTLREACRRSGAETEAQFQAIYYKLRKAGWRTCVELRKHPR